VRYTCGDVSTGKRQSGRGYGRAAQACQPWPPLDAECPTADAGIQNLKILAAMLFAHKALPDIP
jgi:hypothetical protein